MKKKLLVVAKVKSQSDGRKVYTISRTSTGYLNCSCLAHRFTRLNSNGVKPPCKHIKQLLTAVE
jgi:hypothetical protein